MNYKTKRRLSRLLSFLLVLLLLLSDGSLQYVRAAENASGLETVVAETTEEQLEVETTIEQEEESGTAESPEEQTQESESTESPEEQTQESESAEPTEEQPGESSAEPETSTSESEESIETEEMEAEESMESEEATDEESIEESGDMEETEVTEESEEMDEEESEELRAPQDFYEEPASENYGTLVDYDTYSRTYHVEGDQYVTVIGYDGSTYVDEAGNLQQVDNTLVENPMAVFSALSGGTSYINSANDYMVVLNDTVSDGDDVYTVAIGDYMMSMAPLEGELKDGVVADNAIRYNNVLPGIDYQYTVLGNSIKEDIILLEPGEKHSFSYRLNTYGLQTKLINNNIYLYEEGKDPEQDAVFVLNAPEMEDAAGEISFGLHLSTDHMVDENGQAYVLVTVTADSAWLAAPERVYPVRIDPSTVQVSGSAIKIACVEEGSPGMVIGDNGYPYVGYDDGITSGNLSAYGSKHLNCRSYFQFKYDFASLAVEPEIVSATLQVTQRTRWSKGSTEFLLCSVQNEWEVNRLNWNNQQNFGHEIVASQRASATRGESLYFDVKNAVIAWVNGSPNNGLVMKAAIEAPSEETAQAGVAMQCEVFYNSASSAYAPKLIISWTGELTDLAALGVNDTTIDIYPVVARNGDKSSTTLGVVAHGLAQPGSTVHYSLVNGSTGQTVAQTELVYPDSALYKGAYPGALDYSRRSSNWQSQVFSGLTPGQVYYIEAYAEGLLEDGETLGRGATVRSDSFLIYREGAFDLVPRIAQHYGVDITTILTDMRMQDALSKEGNLLFIRNPQNSAAYSSGELSEYYKAVIDGLLLGRAQDCEFGYEPINLNTGNFYMEQEDAAMEDIGGAFSLSRQYNSKGAAYKGSLGYGWTFAYDERLGELADGSVLWLQNNGGIMTFTQNGTGYTAPVGCDYTLTAGENGYTVTSLADGSRHIFDNYGMLSAVEDVQGNRTSLYYDMELRLTRIQSPSGKVYGITLDGEGRITAVKLPDGNSISYTYDGAGNLSQVTDQAGDTLRFEYDDSHYMTAWYDENSHKVVENVYDAEGRVMKQTDAEGGVVTLSYSEGQTVTTDAEGNVTTYTYDDKFRTTGIVYPDDTTEQRAYDAAGYLSQVTDRMGIVTTYTYDVRGNLLREERADGATRAYTYNDQNQVLTITDYDGGVTTYTYDELNRLTAIRDAEGGVTTYTYDEANRVTTQTDARGGVTAYTYEGACITSMTDAEGHTWHYTYDAMNRLLTVTDPLGHTTRNTYDAKGRVTAETDAAGAATLYTFDKAGAVTVITDKEGQKTVFTYDKMNRLLTGTDPLGNTLVYTYDKNGNKLSEIDAEGQTTGYTYDAMNRVIAVTDSAGRITTYTYNGNDAITALTDRRGYTIAYTYDAVKKVLVTETDAEGAVTAYETDSMGRVIRITYADGATESYTWDKLGRMTSSTDRLGMVTLLTYDANGNVLTLKEGEGSPYRYTYDALNRLTKTTDPLGNVTLFTYDAPGNLTRVTDARGNETTYKYDALNRLSTVLDACEGKTGYTYDKEGRVLSVTAPMGDTITYTYDAIGQLQTESDALQGTTGYTYDGISRLLTRTDALGGVTAYTYDANSNLISTTDTMNNTHSYQVDEEGNLLKDTYPNEEVESYTYDGNGNVLTYTDRYGIVTTLTYDAMGRVIGAVDTAGNEMTYTYDKAGNLLTQTDVLGRTTVLTYDIYGRLITHQDVDGAITTYAYDALDRVVKVTDAEGSVTSYAYDETGNLINTTEPGEAQYAYTYDALNRLTRSVDPIGAATTYVYDKNSNLTQVTDGNGITTDYTYDALNRLIIYTDGNDGNTSYKYDPLNRLTAITTPEGLTESYGYDKAGNLLTVTDALGQTTRYTYDDLYRLVRVKSHLGAVESYSYDSHDVVTSVTDALGNRTTFQVDAKGQVTGKTQPNGGSYTYTYDAAARLTGVTTPLGYETTFTYSVGDDLLTQSDNLGRTTTYTYDIMHRLTSLTDAEGGVTTYTYDARGNEAGVTDPLGYTWSYTYDKADRLITVTDPEEKATSLVYDMTGNVTSITLPGQRTTGYTYDANYNRVGIIDPMGYSYSYTYDADDRLTISDNPLYRATVLTYDAVNRIVAVQDGMGLTESYAYDAHGNVLSVTAADGLVTSYTYDLKNRLTSVTDPMGSVAYYTYDVMDNLTAVTDYMGRGTGYIYDMEGNLTSITNAAGRKENMTYDIAGRITSYTSNGGNRITYDYDKLDNLIEKSYTDAKGRETADSVQYAYDANGQRVEMYDSTGDTEYTYDGLGRITSVTTYRVPEKRNEGEFIHNQRLSDTVGYTYDEADNLSAITYPDGTQVSYAYDLNNNLIKVTDREGKETTYVYDAINRITEIHRPNGVSTYNTYNNRDQITALENRCDDCGLVISSYKYSYDDRGYIVSEWAREYLVDTTEYEWNACGHAWSCGHGYDCDDKDGKYDDKDCHGKHYYRRLVETTRTFTYDDAGKLIQSTENENRCYSIINTYEYDLMGNRTAVRKVDSCGRILEQETFTYNDSNQLIKSTYQSGRKRSTLYYGYDRDGNRIYEVGKKGNECVETYYKYDVENRLAAVYDGRELLMAAAYDGDGNRVFQLNYNPTEEKDWKDYLDKNDYPDYSDSQDKNDTGSQDVSSGKNTENQDTSHGAGNQPDADKNNTKDHTDHRVFIGAMAGICNMPGLLRWELNTVSLESSNAGNGRETISKNDSDSTPTDKQQEDKDQGTSDHKQQDSENHEIADDYDVIFPIARDEDRTDYRNYKNGHGIVYDIKTAGRGSDYELIEYINDVNREYTEVLAEQSVHGRTDTSYIYGVDRLSLDGYNGCSGYYLYDPRGSVTGITGECGQLYQSYRYSVTGEITFGAPTYENEYTYNGESYNPNIESQYLRARYYDVVNANFLTEDSYLGDIAQPLTLNRYNYCVSSYPNYQDPSGHQKSSTNNAVEVMRFILNFVDNLGYVTNQKGMNNDSFKGGIAKWMTRVYSEEYYLKLYEKDAELKKYIKDCEPNMYEQFSLSNDYMRWLTIAEGNTPYPFRDTADNEMAQKRKNVTIGIGFTFDSSGRNWDILNEILGWSNEEIENIINCVYSGEDMSKTKYVITEEQVYDLFDSTSDKYTEHMFAAIDAYNNSNDVKISYTQNELEAMFDYSYNNGLNNVDDINNEKLIIYYYLRKDLDGAIDAIKSYGNGGTRRRLNQTNLFFNGTYDFVDSSKASELDKIRAQLGF